MEQKHATKSKTRGEKIEKQWRGVVITENESERNCGGEEAIKTKEGS